MPWTSKTRPAPAMTSAAPHRAMRLGLKNTDIEDDDVVAVETSRGGGTKEEKADRGARGNETNRPATFTKPRPRATVWWRIGSQSERQPTILGAFERIVNRSRPPSVLLLVRSCGSFLRRVYLKTWTRISFKETHEVYPVDTRSFVVRSHVIVTSGATERSAHGDVNTLDFDQVVPTRPACYLLSVRRVAFGRQSEISHDGGQCTLILLMDGTSEMCSRRRC